MTIQFFGTNKKIEFVKASCVGQSEIMDTMEFPIEVPPSHKWWPFVREDGSRFVESPTASAMTSAKEIQELVGSDCWRAVLSEDNGGERKKVTVLFDENETGTLPQPPSPIREAMWTDINKIVPDGALVILTMFHTGDYRVLATRQGDSFQCRVFASAEYLKET